MARQNRVKIDYGYYHFWSRGNNKDNIFPESSDKIAFLNRLVRYVKKFNVQIHSYCIMSNHFHLLVYSNGSDISKFMQGFMLSYAMYFNRSHNHCGHVFQDRFGSELIKDERHLLTVSKYIHNNPVEARICDNASKYAWSSCNLFLGAKDNYNIVQTDFILSIFSKNKKKSISEYAKFMNLPENKEEASKFMEEYIYCNLDSASINKTYNKENLISHICEKLNTNFDEISAKYTKRNTNNKILCQYLLSLKCKLSLSEISRLFLTTPSNVSFGITKFINTLKNDKLLQKKLSKISECIA